MVHFGSPPHRHRQRQPDMCLIRSKQQWWRNAKIVGPAMALDVHHSWRPSTSENSFLPRNLAKPVADARLCCARAPAHRHVVAPRRRPRSELFTWQRLRCDRPRAKGGRSSSLQTGVFFASTTKKEVGFVLLVSPTPTPRMAKSRLWYWPGMRSSKNHMLPVMSATENQPDKNGFFLSSRPEHNQKPPTDTANRHCAFIPTRRKIAVLPQGAQFTAPFD